MKKKETKPTIPLMKHRDLHLSPDMYQKIAKHTSNIRDRLFILVAIRTGRRPGEIRMLKPSDIDWGKRQIYWHILKKRNNDNFINITCDDVTLYLLKSYIEARKVPDNHYVFTKENSNIPMSRWHCAAMFRRAAMKAGLYHHGTEKNIEGIEIPKKLPLYSARHSFAIDYATKATHPADIAKLQKIMQHQKLETTSFYLNFNQEETRATLNEILGYMGLPKSMIDKKIGGKENDEEINIDKSQDT
jgi:integrase